MAKEKTHSFIYRCPFSKCSREYDSPVQLSEYPWCPETRHTRAMDFIEEESSGVPNHVLNDKGGHPPARRKTGGNWIKKENT